MVKEIRFDWFRDNIVPALGKYKIEYSFFENGDFGDLNRIEFEGCGKGGNIDFWQKKWLEIHLYDYQKDQELIHALLKPEEELEQVEKIKELQELLLSV